jgi:hypothetical protein
MRSLLLALACALASLWLITCTSTHTENSTETGNPPVIDVDRVALEVGKDSVHIVGEAGAVMPGGASIEITNVRTGQTVKAQAAPDGSFEVEVMATPQDVLALAASAGSKHSQPVYVARGGAWVGDGSSGLSCQQRSQLASQAIGSALVQATSGCRVAEDCIEVPTRSVCTASCGDALVARTERAAVENTLRSVDDGLCKSFEADGCMLLALPCIPPPNGPIVCNTGRCEQREPGAALDAGTAADGGGLDAGAAPDASADGGALDAGAAPDASADAGDPAGSCPPNRVYVQDRCLSCGLAGGCGETSPGCAIVCERTSDCPSDPNPSFGCSGRKLCEVTSCI